MKYYFKERGIVNGIEIGDQIKTSGNNIDMKVSKNFHSKYEYAFYSFLGSRKKIFGMNSKAMSYAMENFFIKPKISEEINCHFFGDAYKYPIHYMSQEDMLLSKKKIDEIDFQGLMSENFLIPYLCMREYSDVVSREDKRLKTKDLKYIENLHDDSFLRLRCLGCSIENPIRSRYILPCIDLSDNVLKFCSLSRTGMSEIIETYLLTTKREKSSMTMFARFLYDRDVSIKMDDKGNYRVKYIDTKYKCLNGEAKMINANFFIKILQVYCLHMNNGYSGNLPLEKMKKIQPITTYRISNDVIDIESGDGKNKKMTLSSGQTESIFVSSEYKFGRDLEI